MLSSGYVVSRLPLALKDFTAMNSWECISTGPRNVSGSEKFSSKRAPGLSESHNSSDFLLSPMKLCFLAEGSNVNLFR